MRIRWSKIFILATAAINIETVLSIPCRADGICSREALSLSPREAKPAASPGRGNSSPKESPSSSIKESHSENTNDDLQRLAKSEEGTSGSWSIISQAAEKPQEKAILRLIPKKDGVVDPPPQGARDPPSPSREKDITQGWEEVSKPRELMSANSLLDDLDNDFLPSVGPSRSDDASTPSLEGSGQLSKDTRPPTVPKDAK